MSYTSSANLLLQDLSYDGESLRMYLATLDKQKEDLSNQLIKDAELLPKSSMLIQLGDLVELSEKYSAMLTLSSAKETQGDVQLMRNLQDLARSREDRFEEALGLICDLLDRPRAQKESASGS